MPVVTGVESGPGTIALADVGCNRGRP